MSESRFELSIGDSIQFDEQILTVLEICGEEITFRIDSVTDHQTSSLCGNLAGKPLPPR